MASCVAVFVMVQYQIIEKKERIYSQYREEEARRRIYEKIDELKEKERKGLLTDDDYSRYIALHLENINLTLQRLDRKNMREWVITYYEEVNKIPSYFSPQEWKDSEKFIYDSMIENIKNSFSARNIFDSPLRTEALEKFNKERDRLLKAREREYNK